MTARLSSAILLIGIIFITLILNGDFMSSAEEHFQKGLEAFKEGDLETAIRELEDSTQIDQNNYKAFNYLGAAYASKKRLNAAIGAFKVAEQLAPNNASIHYNIAQAYEAAGLLDEAEHEYEKAIKLKTNYQIAIDALNRVKRKLNHI